MPKFLTDPIHPVQLSMAVDTADAAIEKLYRDSQNYPMEHIIHSTEAILNRVGLQAYMSGRDYASSFSDLEKLGWVPDDWSWRDDVKQIIAHMKVKPTQYIMNQIHDALMTGEGPPVEELAKEIGYEQGKAVARTSILNIYVKAALRKWDEDGIEHCKRIEMEDLKTCPICRMLNGKEYLIKELILLPNPQSHDTHENCLLGETPILAPGARKSYVGLYKDSAIEIVFEGGRVVTTPNHMFLTPVGFATSACLRKGDDILYYLGFDGPAPGAHPDDHWKPVAIKDVVNSFSENGGMVSRRVPSSPKDLHGDGAFMDGDIDISSPNGLLLSDSEASFPEKLCESLFRWADSTKVGFSSGRDLTSMLFAMVGATDGGVGVRCQSEPFFSRKPLHSKGVCLACASNVNSGIEKSLLRDGSGYTKSLTNGLFGFSSAICLNNRPGLSFPNPVLNCLGFQNPPYSDAIFNKPALDYLVGNIKAFCDGANGLSSAVSLNCLDYVAMAKSVLNLLRLRYRSWLSSRLNDDPLNDLVGYPKRLGDARDRFSRVVSTRKVLEVNVIPPSHDGLHMYDLETSSSLYIANGLVSSNCRGTMLPIIDLSTYAPKRRGLPELRVDTKNNKAENVPVELYSMLKSIMHGSKLPFNLRFDKSIKPDYELNDDVLVINPKSLVDEDIRELIYSEQAEAMWPSVEKRVIAEYMPLLKYGFAKTSRSWDTPREAFVNNWIAYKLGQSPMDKDFWSQAFFQSLKDR